MGVCVDQTRQEDGARTIDDAGPGAVHGAAHVRGLAGGDDATARGSHRAVLHDHHLSLRAAGLSVQKGRPTSCCAPCSTSATTSWAVRTMAASGGVSQGPRGPESQYGEYSTSAPHSSTARCTKSRTAAASCDGNRRMSTLI